MTDEKKNLIDPPRAPKGGGNGPTGPALSFARLDAALGHEPPTGQTGLEVWYRKVHTLPIDALPVEDIARAVRQRIHLSAVVPRALALLREDRLAGVLYPGELFMALAEFEEEALDPLDAVHKFELLRLANDAFAIETIERLDAESQRTLAAGALRLQRLLRPEDALSVVVEDADGRVQRVSLDEGREVSIGSGPDATIRVARAKDVARRHVILTLDERGAVRMDLFGHYAQRNGALVFDSGVLRVGDVLQFGSVTVRVQAGGEPAKDARDGHQPAPLRDDARDVYQPAPLRDDARSRGREVRSTNERLLRLGLAHLEDDPVGLAVEHERRAREMRERDRKWNAVLTQRLAEEAAAARAKETPKRSTPPTFPGWPTSFLLDDEQAEPECLPDNLHEAQGMWDYMFERVLPPLDLDAPLDDAFKALWHAVDAALFYTDRPLDARARSQNVKDALITLKTRLSSRRPRPASRLSILLALAEAIVAGLPLKRG